MDTLVERSDETVTIPKAEYEALLKAKSNLEYLKMLRESKEQVLEGKVVHKTWEELEAMAADDSVEKAFGIAHKYADPRLQAKEKEAFKNAMVKKHLSDWRQCCPPFLTKH